MEGMVSINNSNKQHKLQTINTFRTNGKPTLDFSSLSNIEARGGGGGGGGGIGSID